MNGPLQVPRGSVAIRTCFHHDAAYDALLKAWSTENEDGFRAWMETYEDRRLDGQDPMGLIGLLAEVPAVLVVVDRFCLEHPEHAALVIDASSRRSLRVIPSEMWSIENNLSIANMDFEEFYESRDHDGVFRGFVDAQPDPDSLIEPRRTVQVTWSGLSVPAGVDPVSCALSQPVSGTAVYTTCEYDSLLGDNTSSGAGLHCVHADVALVLTSCPRCLERCRSHMFCARHAERVRTARQA